MADTVEIKGIWLRREGDYAVVDAWMPDGTYREVIREHLEGPFSHCVHAGGIKAAKTPCAACHAAPAVPGSIFCGRAECGSETVDLGEGESHGK